MNTSKNHRLARLTIAVGATAAIAMLGCGPAAASDDQPYVPQPTYNPIPGGAWTPIKVVHESDGSGFDLGDASLGASGGALGAGLVAYVALRRRRVPQAA